MLTINQGLIFYIYCQIALMIIGVLVLFYYGIYSFIFSSKIFFDSILPPTLGILISYLIIIVFSKYLQVENTISRLIVIPTIVLFSYLSILRFLFPIILKSIINYLPFKKFINKIFIIKQNVL